MRDLARRARSSLAALAIFVAAGVAVLHPALFGDQVLSAGAPFLHDGPFPADVRATPEGLTCYSDSMCCFVPWLRWSADAFAADGRIPLWKDTAGTGAPFVGNGQSAAYFPTNLVPLLLGAPPRSLAFAALAKLVGGAFCAWLLARHLQLSFLASTLCGLVFGFGGFQMGFFLHPLTNVSLLLPLLVLAADRVAQRPSLPRAGLLAAVAALQHLGGHPETAFHCQAAIPLIAGARALSLRRTIGLGQAWGRVAWVVAALALGGVLAAIQLLPLLEYMRESASLAARGGEREFQLLAHPLAAACFAAALVGALLALRRLARSDLRPGWSALLLGGATFGCVLAGLHAGMQPTFVTMLAPDWFGTPLHFLGPAVYIGETAAYAGVALPLAALGLLRGRPRGPALVAGVVLVLGCLAGYTAPLVADLLDTLPIFRLALNARLVVLALLAAAVLVGLGLDALGELAREARLRWRVALALLAPALAAVAALACAVQLGTVSARDTPGVPQGSSYVDVRLLPAESLAPFFADVIDTEPSRVFYGLALPAGPVTTIQLRYGRAGTLAATQWKEAPAVEGASVPNARIFRAAIPQRDLPPGPLRMRVHLSLPDASLAVSAPLADPDAPAEDSLPFPARPAPGTSALHLAALALVLGLVSLAPAGGRRLAGLRVLLLVLVGGSLLVFDAGLIPLLPAHDFYPPAPALDLLRSARPEGRMVCLRSDVMPAELPTYYGIADLRSYDALEPARVLRMVDVGVGWPRSPDRGSTAPASARPDLPLLGLMGVKFLIGLTPRSSPIPIVPVPFRDWQAMARDVPFTIVQNPDFLPRARLVGGAVVEADDERALSLLRDAGFPRASTVVLAEGSPRETDDADAGSAEIVLDRPEQVRVRIAPRAAGWLVLSDTFFPGWKALVDGQPREILRANVAFRAVAVQPGESLVEFRYEPAVYRAGVIVSLVSGILLVAACLFARAAARRRAAAPEA